MANQISWFELPATDISRAKTFYQTILGSENMVETEMFGTKMAFLPNDGQSVSGAIVQGEDYYPSKEGTLIYLNGGKDLSIVLSRVESAGGTVIVPKTHISAEMGYFAIFFDTEGNKVALHSIG